ncbi:hypothetical protein ACPPVU_22285 [Mucilaginibacter sp. McL0603]|uniref:hypothetical protein n=1 Tax=Mucilaginibacter sp. McL0603 TaxID=3415670 RepID=UPI003CF3A14E
MRAQIIFRIAAVLLITWSANNLFGQTMKTDTMPTLVISSKSAISPKVTEAFDAKFKNDVNTTWYNANKNYMVKFMTQDQKNAALYNKNGYLVYHIKYGNASSLPNDLSNMIYKKYKDCKITTVIHIEQESRSIWAVDLEYGQYLILARIENDQVQEIQRLRNGATK